MSKSYENAVGKGTTLEKEAGFILYFVTHWICTLYETCGVSICFLASCTISDNIGKPKVKQNWFWKRILTKGKVQSLVNFCKVYFYMSELHASNQNLFTIQCYYFKKPFVTPNFCKRNLSRMHHFRTVNFSTFKIALVPERYRVPDCLKPE